MFTNRRLDRGLWFLSTLKTDDMEEQSSAQQASMVQLVAVNRQVWSASV